MALIASAALIEEAPSPLGLLFVCFALVVGDLPVVHVRHGDQNHTFTWSEAALVTGLVLLPAGWLPLVGVGVIALAHLGLRRPPMKAAFNAFSFATSAFLARATQLGIDWALDEPPLWLSLGAAALVYFAWNTTLVSLAIACSRGVPVSTVLRGTTMLATLFAIANTCVAVLIATAASEEPFVLLAVPPILVQMAFAYRNTREVIGERDLWEKIQGVSEQLQRTRTANIPDVAVRAVHGLVPSTLVELVIVEGRHAERFLLAGDTVSEESGAVDELTDGLWGRVTSDRSSFRLEVATASPRQQARLQAERIESALVVPLEWGGRLHGALRVGFNRRQRPTPRVESALSTVGTQIASAIASARQTDRLRHQADHDELTGLPNRKRLVEVLSVALHGARRSATGAGTAVLFLDLDDFKVVNDSLGHHIGDDVLVEAARRIRTSVRPEDVVARFGGDEFIVVCQDVDERTATVVAHRVLEALAESADIRDRRVTLSASLGIAHSVDGETDPEAMLRDADAAMYEAKRLEPGTAVVFTSSLRQQALERLHLEGDLRVALDTSEIDVHFQPIVEIGSGRILELEALARWNHPVRGSVSPSTFISVAEDTGQIRRLGEVVLNRACAEMRRWLTLGLVGTDVRVAVNLSARQLDRTLPRVVGEALARHGLPASSLTLEVTESALVDDEDAVASLERLREIGVTVSLDDFGTGFSSLSALRDLPVDTVKIDRSFVERMGDDDRMTAMVRGIIDLAHALHIDVIAEGVEETLQATLLREFGCDRAQGWLYGRPMSISVTETALAEDRRMVVRAPQVPADDSASHLRLARA